MELVGDEGDGLVAMAQTDLGGGDDGLVDPLFGGDAAGLTDDGAQIALGEADLVGIEGEAVLLAAVLVDEADEAVEDVGGAAAARRCVRLATGKEAVVVGGDGGDEVVRDLDVALGCGDLAEEAEEMAGEEPFMVGDGEDAVLLPAAEEVGQLASVCQMEHVGRYAHAHDLEVGTDVEGLDDGAGGDEDDGAGGDVILLQVDDATHAALTDVAHAVLLKQEGTWSAAYEGVEEVGEVDDDAEAVAEVVLRGELVVLAEHVEHGLQCE